MLSQKALKQEQTISDNFKNYQDYIGEWTEGAAKKWQDKDEMLFELTFCICTPQSKAPMCRQAVKQLRENGLLWAGTPLQVKKYLKGVRFNVRKSKFIVEARGTNQEIFDKVQELSHKPLELREWLSHNVPGFGHKEASHFLRNIGLGKRLAILDVHVIRAMIDGGHIRSKAAQSMTAKRYLAFEQVFQSWANRLKMTPTELDSTIWLMRSGNQELM